MAITTDFVGQIDIEPALSSEQLGHLAHLHELGRGDGRPPHSSGWVASADGGCLTVKGGNQYGDPAEWLRHLIKCFIKPAGLRADGMVVGCRRGTRELFSIQVSANRVSQKELWPRSAQPREARRQPPPRRSASNVIDLATRRARA
jgi:hypothetical protein